MHLNFRKLNKLRYFTVMVISNKPLQFLYIALVAMLPLAGFANSTEEKAATPTETTDVKSEIKEFIKGLMSDRKKLLESYSSYVEFEHYVMDSLKKYNIFQSEMNHLIDFYTDIIKSAYDEGRQPLSVAEEIAKELKLSTGGLMQYKMDGTNRSQAITYL